MSYGNAKRNGFSVRNPDVDPLPWKGLMANALNQPPNYFHGVRSLADLEAYGCQLQAAPEVRDWIPGVPRKFPYLDKIVVLCNLVQIVPISILVH